MRIDALTPDTAVDGPTVTNIPASASASGFAQILDAAGASLDRADGAERAFAHGTGGLQEMVVARAQADITLAVATAGAQRAAQALNTLLGMQI
jgi:flagellar hook-basal body complex protein FliE